LKTIPRFPPFQNFEASAAGGSQNFFRTIVKNDGMFCFRKQGGVRAGEKTSGLSIQPSPVLAASGFVSGNIKVVNKLCRLAFRIKTKEKGPRRETP